MNNNSKEADEEQLLKNQQRLAFEGVGGRCVVMGSLAGKSAEWFQKSSLRKSKHTHG